MVSPESSSGAVISIVAVMEGLASAGCASRQARGRRSNDARAREERLTETSLLSETRRLLTTITAYYTQAREEVNHYSSMASRILTTLAQ